MPSSILIVVRKRLNLVFLSLMLIFVIVLLWL